MRINNCLELFDNLKSAEMLMLFFSEQAIGLMSRVFANGPGDRGSIPGRSHTKD